jgi:RimJ/RimL family protein N-acetyltransferase
MEPIELSGDGLLLRAWQPDDAEAVFRACQDPLIHRWTLVPSPYTMADAELFTGPLTQKSWASESSAPLGIFDARTGDLLGATGLVVLSLTARTGEIGTWVAPWARGQAVAERAGRAVGHWAFEVLRLRRLAWRAEVGNHASKLVAERIGFTFDGLERAGLVSRDGTLADCWHGVAVPGEIRETPPPWVATGAGGARRARALSDPPERIQAGPRHSLRAPDEQDLDDVVATCTDPESVKWTAVAAPYGPEQAVSFLFRKLPQEWLRGTAAGFVMADADNRYAGTIYLRFDPLDPATGEIGFLVAPWARGRGLATAATRAICEYGFVELALMRILWRAYVGNDASRRVAEKAGFEVEGVQRLGLEQRGERRDGWVATLLAGEL